MAEWGRDTPWRQGHVLPGDAVRKLGLIPADACAESVVAVIVSHDCDLAQPPDAEPDVEVIVGHRVETLDGNCTHAKNARRLHLTYGGAGRTWGVELRSSAKKPVLKERLAEHLPAASFSPTPGERAILQNWLAARYRRAAFPDEFDRRLSATGLRDRLAKILKPFGTHIAAVFFDVDGGEIHERSGPDDPYTIAVYLLYSTETDPETAEEAARQAAFAIRKAFQDRCIFKPRMQWQDFELAECLPIADTAMTIFEANRLKRWNADHISLRTDPQQAMLREG
jgi:hypothetical protein